MSKLIFWFAVAETLLLLFIFNLCYIEAFNLSPVPNLKIKPPNLRTFQPQTRSSYFGFTIILREKSIIIGAPRAQSTLQTQSSINETGIIYRCPIELKRGAGNGRNSPISCEPYIFESASNLFYSDHRFNEVRDHQWLGGAMDGGTKDDEPLLVCASRFDGGERYDEQTHDYMHGICYQCENTLTDDPRSGGILKFKPLTLGTQVYGGVYYHQLGQMGFSAHITPDNKEYIMGAPGVNNWAGSVVRYVSDADYFDIPSQISKHQLVLTGYAVSSGYFNPEKPNQLYYLTTSPHENMELGQAYIYRYASAGSDQLQIFAVLKGSQYGEFYGYAALVLDLNGDKLDDIVISAPQYRLDGVVDVGAIYVYINTGNFQFERQIIVAPFTTEARFGTSIMDIGDINKDGFKDIAVGAPLALDNGAVAIYLGGPQGLQSKPSQILQAPSSNSKIQSYFGHSQSKGVDIDSNGYNDIAIGAPNDETVYIYRSYPVVKIVSSITANERRIDLQTDEIEYRICFRVNSDFPVPLTIEVLADEKLKRIRLEDNNTNRLQLQVMALRFEKCQEVRASITFMSNHIFEPLETQLSYSVINDGKQQNGAEFCEKCVVTDPRSPNSTISVVKYKHGCANEVCNVDLAIKSMDAQKEITIGSLNILAINYNISNIGEKAFDVQLNVSNSLNLPLARIPSNCFLAEDHQMSCEVIKGSSYLETYVEFTIEYDISQVANASVLNVTATVASMGNELRSTDNTITDRIQLELYSNLEIIGYPHDNLFIFEETETTQIVEYNFKLHNLGPSVANNIEISTFIPFAYQKDSNSEEIEFINITQIYLTASIDDQEIPHTLIELAMPNVTTDDNEDASNMRRVFNNLQQRSLSKNRTIFLQCREGSGTSCLSSTIKLTHLEASQTLNLQYKIVLQLPFIRKILSGFENNLGLFWQVTATAESFLKINKLLTPILLQHRAIPTTPLWIYILAILGGLLLLTLLTFSLWKLGFFNRQSKEDMQKLLDQKQACKNNQESPGGTSTPMNNQSLQDLSGV